MPIESWINLKQQLPEPGQMVFWYDSMFDNIMYFALENPASHDRDFSHFSRIIPLTRPQEHEEPWKGKAVGFYHDKARYTWSIPCSFDHNAECLVCDCWPSQCAYVRYLKQDYRYETKEQLEGMFRNFQKLQQNQPNHDH